MKYYTLRYPLIGFVGLVLTACGGGGDGGGSTASTGGAGPGSSTVVTVTVPSVLALLAGAPLSGQGSIDGAGLAAEFFSPTGVAVDSSGNTYVADTGNSTIRKITVAGVVTTLAGTAGITGSADGTGAAAQFNSPSGVAVDASGNVYVADSGNSTIRMITSAGVVTTLAGSAAATGSTDGTGAAALFNGPANVAVDSTHNVYVADTNNDTIRKITSAGVVTTLAGTAGVTGSLDGTGTAALFSGPTDLALDVAGNLYVADTNNNTVRKITALGVVSTLAGTAGTVGSADGTGAAAQFNDPSGVVVDATGNVYVTDTGNGTVREITAAGVVSTLAGTAGTTGSADGTGAAVFNGPTGIALDSSDNAYVADTGNNTIREISVAGVVTTLAGTAPNSGDVDGTGASAQFNAPAGVATDSSGNTYVADTGNSTIREINPAGVVTTLAGMAGTTGSIDDTGLAAQFSAPSAVAVDSANNIYVADTGNNTIRKISAGGVVTTLAGTAGITGSADGTGAAASFSSPTGVAADSAGNVYVADSANNTVRKITPAGVVTTLAGTSGTSGSVDGTGAAARFNGPADITVDATGNVYVTDMNNDTVRKITSAGVVSTLAGTAGTLGSADGTGIAAQFSAPAGITTDVSGNIFVADMNNDTIRKITAAGVVSTVVGVAGNAGYKLGALPGLIGAPNGLAMLPNGSLVFSADTGAILTVTGL